MYLIWLQYFWVLFTTRVILWTTCQISMLIWMCKNPIKYWLLTMVLDRPKRKCQEDRKSVCNFTVLSNIYESNGNKIIQPHGWIMRLGINCFRSESLCLALRCRNVPDKDSFDLVYSHRNTPGLWLQLCLIVVNNPVLTLITTPSTNQNLTCLLTGETIHTEADGSPSFTSDTNKQMKWAYNDKCCWVTESLHKAPTENTFTHGPPCLRTQSGTNTVSKQPE